MSRNFELLRKNYNDAIVVAERPRSMGKLQLPPRPHRHQSGAAWTNAIRPLFYHWRLAGGFFLLIMSAVVAVTFLMTPFYEPMAKLQIDPPGSSVFAPDRSGGTIGEYLETQANNLQTDALLLMVIRQLRLDQNRIMVPHASTESTVVNQDPSAPRVTSAEDKALRYFRDRLKVRRDTSSRIVMVSFSSPDPELSARVVNTLVNTYIQKTYEMRRAAITESTAWLSKQLDDIRGKMISSNQALAEFQKTTGIVDVDDNTNSYAEQMTDLSKQLVQVSAERMQLQSYLNKVNDGNADSLPQIRSSPVVQALTQKMAETKSELAMTTVIYGKNHPNVAKLQNQQEELQRQLAAQRQAIVDELRTTHAATVSRERMMSGAMRGTTKEMTQLAQYNTLKKEAQANRELYNSLYSKVKEAAISASSPSNDLNVVDAARVLTAPTTPKIPLNLAAGFLFALLGGVVAAFLYDRVDSRIRTPEEIRNHIGAANVSILPAIEQRTGGVLKFTQNLLPGHQAPPQVFMLQESSTPEAEALRGLATSVLLSAGGRPPQVLLVASSFPGEGKTTIAANLAVVLAERGPTCIVDADLRRPRIAAIYGVPPTGGLREVLSGSATTDEFLVPLDGMPNLVILPAGQALDTPGALISSEAMRNLIIELREKFEFVVLDSPPILPYADGRVLATHADGVIFVGRSGVTTPDAMNRAMELLATSQSAPVLEVVLNGTRTSGSPQYYQYRYR